MRLGTGPGWAHIWGTGRRHNLNGSAAATRQRAVSKAAPIFVGRRMSSHGLKRASVILELELKSSRLADTGHTGTRDEKVAETSVRPEHSVFR